MIADDTAVKKSDTDLTRLDGDQPALKKCSSFLPKMLDRNPFLYLTICDGVCKTY